MSQRYPNFSAPVLANVVVRISTVFCVVPPSVPGCNVYQQHTSSSSLASIVISIVPIIVVVVVVVIVVVIVVVVIVVVVVGHQSTVKPGTTWIPVGVSIGSINPEAAGIDHVVVDKLSQEVEVLSL